MLGVRFSFVRVIEIVLGELVFWVLDGGGGCSMCFVRWVFFWLGDFCFVFKSLVILRLVWVVWDLFLVVFCLWGVFFYLWFLRLVLFFFYF